MKKFIERISKKEHQKLNTYLVTELKKLGFRLVTSRVLKKIYRVYNLDIPEVLRTTDVTDRNWYIKDINGYTISVHTSFNARTQMFSPYSAPSMVIEPIHTPRWLPKQKSKLTRFFYRSSHAFVQHIALYAQFFSWEFEENRPLTRKGSWAFFKEVRQDEFEWYGPEGSIRDLFVHAKAQAHIYVYTDQKKRLRYFKKYRVKLGYKKTRRQMRKTYRS
jgi:hypothetical protein